MIDSHFMPGDRLRVRGPGLVGDAVAFVTSAFVALVDDDANTRCIGYSAVVRAGRRGEGAHIQAVLWEPAYELTLMERRQSAMMVYGPGFNDRLPTHIGYHVLVNGDSYTNDVKRPYVVQAISALGCTVSPRTSNWPPAADRPDTTSRMEASLVRRDTGYQRNVIIDDVRTLPSFYVSMQKRRSKDVICLDVIRAAGLLTLSPVRVGSTRNGRSTGVVMNCVSATWRGRRHESASS